MGGHRLYILEYLSDPESNAFVSDLSVAQWCKDIGRYVIKNKRSRYTSSVSTSQRKSMDQYEVHKSFKANFQWL
jgi:hypothetical protein